MSKTLGEAGSLPLGSRLFILPLERRGLSSPFSVTGTGIILYLCVFVSGG
jgi:hypothetical protein